MIKVPDPVKLVNDIRKAQSEKNFTISEVISLMKEKGYTPCGTSTISRVLSGDTEDANFDYLYTVIPLYNTLIEDTEDKDIKIELMQHLLEYKMSCIEELKAQLENQAKTHKEDIAQLKDKYHDKMDKEMKKFQEIMDFKSKQIELKDERLTKMIDTNAQLTDHIVNCPYRGKCE